MRAAYGQLAALVFHMLLYLAAVFPCLMAPRDAWGLRGKNKAVTGLWSRVEVVYFVSKISFLDNNYTGPVCWYRW